MSPPTVRINTFVQPTAKLFIDSITKVYIIGELILGVNRLPIITENWVYIVSGLIYSGLALCESFYYIFKYLSEINIFNITIILNMSLHCVCIIFGFVFYKRMRLFHCELNKFDIEVGCKPRFIRGSIDNLIQTGVMIVFIIIINIIPYFVKTLIKLPHYLMPTQFIQTVEIFYYGHLFNLLIPRLRLINHYMCVSLTYNKDNEDTILKELKYFTNYNKNTNYQMKKIMDMYNIIVQSYNYLVEAIKWQLLMIIITTFITVLGVCYDFTVTVIRKSEMYPVNTVVMDVGVILIVMIPLFAPCVFGDRVQNEVRLLRGLLASRLYENKLDKSSRSIARKLLIFTETRNLSFTLLRVLDINISLPFKFVGLLATYLIILLQFEKVLNPKN